MTWSSNPGAYGATDPLFLLLAALALEAYLGGPWIAKRRYLQPNLPLTNLITKLERRLNRSDRGGLDLLLRGAFVAVVLSLAAFFCGLVLEWLLVNYPFAWVFEVFLLALIVGQRTPCLQASEVSTALVGGSVIAAQEALRPLVVGRITPDVLGQLDHRGIAAAAIDGLARAFAVRVVAPVFWFVLLGLPGVFLQQAIRTAAAFLSARQLQNRPAGRDPLQGHEAAGRADFAATALRLDTALSILPMLLADIVLILAAVFIPGCSPREAIRRAWESRGSLAATMGGVLGLESQAAQGGLGSAGVPLDQRHIERSVAVFAVGCLINAGFVAALAWTRAIAID
ncbi:cobalamin biosynthesis protein [Pelagibius sp. Alg239-R121]|uniref:cobalamin biosynthesis protein n=1 Tax=Pelagibius sp. Alg239-R121 TaxID=2993448 RepID=UPI0024A68B69|nr:cobalamin biosynthesis protein [Pelagibius sp. Alg239-R121]